MLLKILIDPNVPGLGANSFGGSFPFNGMQVTPQGGQKMTVMGVWYKMVQTAGLDQ